MANPKRTTGRFFILSVSSEGVGVARYSFFAFVFLAVALIGVSKVAPEATARLRAFVTDQAAPLLSAASAPFVALSDTIDNMTQIRSLRAENIRLAAENLRLKEWYEKALYLEAENQSLRDFLNLKKDPELAYITTRIVADSGGSFVKSFLVPVGSSDGVMTGQAVLSGRGLIGRVTEVGKTSARVLMITDLNARIPVILQDTHQRAILAGRNGDKVYLERLPPDSGVAKGVRVLTSGDGGLIPAGLPVGAVINAGPDGIEVAPFSDPSSVAHVQIVQSPVDPSLVTGDLAPDQPVRK